MPSVHAKREAEADPRGAPPRGGGADAGAGGANSRAESGGPRMSLGEHLDELRRRLIKGILAIALAFGVAWWFQDETNRIVLAPLQRSVAWLNEDLAAAWQKRIAADPSIEWSDHFVVGTGRPGGEETPRLRAPIDPRPQATGPGEAFVGNLKAALYLALFVGGPVLLWQLWLFVAAGLYEKERRIVLAYFPTSALLFGAGTLFGYFVMVPYGIYFLNSSIDLTQVRPDFRYSQYFGFLSSLCIGLGVIFQLPVVMTAFARVGLVQSAAFAKWRRHFIVGAFIVAAIVTPPDPFTQSMIAVPMVLLYEVGIFCGKLAERRHGRAETAAPAIGGEGAA